MSTFSCPIVELNIIEHPNADSIEIAEVGLFKSIVRKGEFKTGDLAIYIPEATLCTEEVMRTCHAWNEEKGQGKLAGFKYNRVKPIKLRGVISEGLIHPLIPVLDVCELGQDVSGYLGLTKYEPPIPSHLTGPNQPRIAGELFGYTPSFDVENLKKYKNAFEIGETVRVTEKLHGTCCIIGCFLPGVIDELGIKTNKDNLYKERLYVGTKRLTKAGIVFDPNDQSTVYARINTENGILDKMIKWCNNDHYFKDTASVVLLGEIFGKGVQDLGYSCEPQFRVFDIWVSSISKPKIFKPLDNFCIANICIDLEIPQVPLIYSGPYKPEIHEYKEGNSFLDKTQIREGIVIRSLNGDKLYKLISNAYLARKGVQTEYE